MKKLVWEELRNNEVLEGDGFYISYNKDTGTDHLGGMLTELGNTLGANLKDGTETALCYEGRFDILEGDFRKEYEEAFPQGLGACKEVFKKHEAEHRSNWTT